MRRLRDEAQSKADQPGAEYKGKDYYFCNAAERDAFVQSPLMYTKK